MNTKGVGPFKVFSLNERPRKTLDFATPKEQFNGLLAEWALAG